MRATGVVVSIASDSMSVQVNPQTHCGNCQEKKGCGTSVFGSLFSLKPNQFQVPRLTGVSTGSTVFVELPDSLILKLATIGYGLPIFLLLLFAIISQYILAPAFDTNLVATTGGLIGFLGGLFAYKPLSANCLKQMEDPVVVRAAIDREGSRDASIDRS